MVVHERTAKRMERTRTTATTTKTDSASRQRFAHFTSVRRIDAISSSRSSAGFPASQSAGAERGERRMNAPATQKRGNTERVEISTSVELGRKNILTESKFEEIHRKRRLVRDLRVRRRLHRLLV